jgi:hypothetical protein
MLSLLLVSSACGSGGGRDLSVDQLAQVVAAEQPGLKHCYDAALEKHPYKREMRLEALIHIAPSGTVDSVELKGGGGLPGMAECLSAAIHRWQFPKAEAPTHASLPIVFQPEVVQQTGQPGIEVLQQALRELNKGR